MRLKAKRALVVGAARGIGRAIAERFQAEGAILACFDLTWEDPLAGATCLTVDITREESVDTGVKEAGLALGGVDVLVNAAASRTPTSDIAALPPEVWRQAFEVNITGMFLTCRAVLPSMRAAGHGVIVNLASQLGSVGVKGSAAYCATKGAVLQFTRALALDCADQCIRVNSLSPGAVLGARLQARYGSDEATEAALASRHPLGRLGRAGEIAGAAVFLASPDSGFMTGADLIVDGGYTAQ